jgi:hypothetical protein
MDKIKAREILNQMIEAAPEAMRKKGLMFVVGADIYFAIGRKSYKGYKIINGSLYDLPPNYGILANSKDVNFAMKNWNTFKKLKEKFPNESSNFLASII